MLEFHGFVKDLVGLFVRLSPVHLPVTHKKIETQLSFLATNKSKNIPQTQGAWEASAHQKWKLHETQFTKARTFPTHFIALAVQPNFQQ